MMATILTVDDEEGIRSFVAEALGTEGHTVIQAADGAEALLQLASRPFDLLIVDLRMPGDIGGMDVARAARAEYPAMQVVVMTAHGSVSTAVEAMRLGAFEFLEKPIAGPDALRACVTRAMNWRGTPATLLAPATTRRSEPGGPSSGFVSSLSSPPRLFSFLTELRRRHVYQVAASYAAIGFVLLQTAELLLPVMPAPGWAYAGLVALTVGGFPLALALGWVYDLTETGIRRAPPSPQRQ